jgi:hypothetical protein
MTLGLFALILALPDQSEERAPESRPGPVCGAEISHPLDVRVVLLESPRPGARIALSVEVEARALLEDVTIELRPHGPGVLVLGGGRAGWAF